MGIACLFRKARPSAEELPGFIRSVDDVGGLRILRLQGDVGKDIGPAVHARNEAVEHSDVFSRPLLLDFAATTHCDFSTVSFLVDTLRRRMAARARVGLINVPQTLHDELEIARLEELFQVYPSEADAVAALGTH